MKKTKDPPKYEQAIEPGIVERPPGSETFYVKITYEGRKQYYKVRNVTQGRKLRTRLQAQILENRYIPQKVKMTILKAWIARYLEGSSNRDQRHEYQRAMYWSDKWGHKNLADITQEDIRQEQARMQRTGTWSDATTNRYFSALRRVLTLAVQDGKLGRHPMKGIKFLPEPQQDRSFSQEELKAIQKLEEPKDWKEEVLAIETMLRASEQFHARWNTIDWEAKTLTIPLPKGNRTRRIPLSEEALAILRSLDSIGESPWIFPDPRDPLQPRNPYLVGAHFKRTIRKAGIQNASWHTLRHTGATRRLLAGVDIFTVSKILGHVSLETTKRYLHLIQDHLHDAINKGSLTASPKEEISNRQG